MSLWDDPYILKKRIESMQSIYRSIYRAQAKPAQAEAARKRLSDWATALPLGTAPGDLLTVSLLRWGLHIFAYWESIGQPRAPETLFPGFDDLLEAWPGATPDASTVRTFVPMMDIFHYLAPENLAGDPVEAWRRSAPVEQAWGRLARLQPPMVSSYIFLHYQMQEEKPGVGDQYGLIALHEDLIFFYQERPSVLQVAEKPGKLSTTNTPDHWHDVMFAHFHLWEDAPPGQEIWREIEPLLHRTV